MRKRVISILLTLCLVLTLLPSTALAVGGPTPTSTSLSVGNISGEAGAAVTLTATLTSSGSPVSVQLVTFSIDSLNIGSANTGADGVASLSYTINVSAGAHTIGASFAGNSSYNSSSGLGTLTVAADTTPPASPAYSPLDSTAGVEVDVTPTLTFSEALYSDASGTPMSATPTDVIIVYENSGTTGTLLGEGAGEDNAHFTVAYNPANYIFTVTFGAALNNSHTYYIGLQSNSIYDAAGNAISSVQVISFTTAQAFLFAGGTGTSGDPYKISTDTQLIKLAELVKTGAEDPLNDVGYSTLYYELTSDITLNGEWTPIGTSQKKFNGHFNGKGHTISGLTISSGNCVGLFGYADTGSEIKNVGLKEICIRSTGSGSIVGGIAGCSDGTVSGCWVSGSVASTGSIVGGVVGNLNTGGSITDCYSAANVSGSTYVGGIVGGTRGPVSFCYATGSVSSSGSNAGGIVGWGYSSTDISNCAALNLAVSGGSDVGRIVGGTSSTTGMVGNVALENMTGGDFGADRGISTKNGEDKTAAQIAAAGFWTKNTGPYFQDDWSSTIWDKAAGRLPKLRNYSSSQPEQTFPFGGADGSDADNAYLISSEYQLRLLAILVNAGNTDYNSKHYRLTADIALNTYTDDNDGVIDAGDLSNPSSLDGSPIAWTPIGNETEHFHGTFDGDGHAVSGVYINSSSSYQGLFGYLSGSVTNLGVTDSYIASSENDVGGIAGFTDGNGTVSNCYNTGSVSGAADVGGIAGFTDSTTGTVSNCYNTGSVSGAADVGGIVGGNDIPVSNCYNTGSVSGESYVGGAIGSSNGTVTDCYYDKQMCSFGGINGEDVPYSADGKATIDMVGTKLQSSLGTASDWTFESLLYPRLADNGTFDMNETEAAYVSASPVALAYMYVASYDTVTAVKTDFTVSTANGVIWTSSDTNVISISGNIAEIVHSNSNGVTLTASVYSVSRSVRLFSVTKYSSVTYDANGGSGTAPVETDKEEGVSFTALANRFTAPSGKQFDSWDTSADGTGTSYAPGATITMHAVDLVLYAIWEDAPSYGGSSSPSRTITVTETSSPLFSGAQGTIKAEANMTSAFSNSVEVKVTDTDEGTAGFGLGIGNMVYPFDISLYIKGTDTKTQPKNGYAVTISLPVPEALLSMMEQMSVVHKGTDGTVRAIASQLKRINGAWYLVFEATDFSPYALVVNSTGAYDEKVGLPFYVDTHGTTTFIGFAANGKHIAPSGVTVLLKRT